MTKAKSSKVSFSALATTTNNAAGYWRRPGARCLSNGVMTETSRKDESLRRRLIELTRDLIIIPSTRDHPDDIDRCMEFVINHVELPTAVKVHRFREEGSPSTVILPHDVPIPEVMLLA